MHRTDSQYLFQYANMQKKHKDGIHPCSHLWDNLEVLRRAWGRRHRHTQKPRFCIIIRHQIQYFGQVNGSRQRANKLKCIAMPVLKICSVHYTTPLALPLRLPPPPKPYPRKQILPHQQCAYSTATPAHCTKLCHPSIHSAGWKKKRVPIFRIPISRSNRRSCFC